MDDIYFKAYETVKDQYSTKILKPIATRLINKELVEFFPSIKKSPQEYTIFNQIKLKLEIIEKKDVA